MIYEHQRHGGDDKKVKKILSLILEEKLDFMVVQETKMENIDGQVCEQLFLGARGVSIMHVSIKW